METELLANDAHLAMHHVLVIVQALLVSVCCQHERARVIYKYALNHLPKDKCEEVYRQYTVHEKKFGDRTAIEDVIVSKRKFKYEEVTDCLIVVHSLSPF